jgi:ADP-heptose:LPS heptosyltransferase
MGIGDNLMFLRSLLNFEWKQEELIWVIKPEFEGVLHHHFPNSKFFTFELSHFRLSDLLSTKSLAGKIKNENIDRTIILDYKTKPVVFFLVLLFILGIKNIKCTATDLLCYFNKNLFNIKDYSSKHEVERYMDLLSFFSPTINKANPNLINEGKKFNSTLMVENNIIVFAPGSVRKAKRWSINKFIELAQKFIGLGYVIVFVGGINDKYLIQPIKDSLPDDRIKNFIGKLSFIETGAWIKRSKLVVSNDSAIMHYADLIDKPVVAIFGITDPYRCGPFTQINNCIVYNSYYPKYSYGPFPDNVSDKFINEITVDTVFDKCIKILDNEKN